MINLKGKYTEANIHIDNVDETTISQITKMINNSFFTSKIEIMPDCHAGKGSVIGFTMPLAGLKIIPNIIGVDVNCGMVAVRLDGLTDKQKGKFNAKNEKYMTKLDTRIRELIPMGFNIHDSNDLDSKISPEKILEKIAKDAKAEAVEFSHKFYNRFGIKIIDKMPDYTSDEYFKKIIKRTGISEKRLFGGIGTLGGGRRIASGPRV